MKIALINLVIDTNYGGNLQRFALCKVLQNLGHDVIYIVTYPQVAQPSFIKKLLIFCKRIILKLKNKDICIFHEHEISKDYRIQMRDINRFLHENIPCYHKSFLEFDDFTELNSSNFDAFLVGSDQVWRSSNERNIEHYFLDFVNNNTKKIAYAASFGNGGKGYTPQQIIKCKELISHFSAISVRENSGIDAIKEFKWNTSCDINITLDPTLLLSKERYTELFSRKKLKQKYGLFYYILDFNEEKNDLVSKISQELNLETYGISTLFPNYNKKTKIINPSIEQWIKYICDAEFIITDSYHGTLFSIIFNKPFISIINSARGFDRYYPLIEILGLNQNLISTPTQIPDLKKIINFDWGYTNNKLDELRKKSLAFLKSI